jgi:hypothetical protein
MLSKDFIAGRLANYNVLEMIFKDRNNNCINNIMGM